MAIVTALAELLGESPGIVAARDKIRRLLRRDTELRRFPPILIQGETGTGKGLLARAIHRAGPRAAGPFVDVNCAAIPETLLEAELFGFERGAFTDARQAKPGLFQVAHRGTIFLDEVGLLPEALQAKLLKVIEERAVRRLGSTRSEPVDVWILTATSEDLATATRARCFREDLYHRLAVLTLWLPPLRERGRDILPLAEHFLARACADYGLPPKTLAPEVCAALLGYRWPGNVRELANVMERVVLLSEAAVVGAEMLGLPEAVPERPRPGTRVEEAIPLEDVVGSVERQHLLEALQQTSWNITRAAALLGISRNTLRYRIEKYGLGPGMSPSPPRLVETPAPPAPEVKPAAASVVPAPAGIRWERRRLTLLHAVLVPQGEEISALDTSRPLEVLVEKAQGFGGRVEDLSPTGMVAVFGLEPVEDAPRRAALAATAIERVAERARRDNPGRPGVKIGIHTGQFLVSQVGGAVQIDLEAKRQAGAVLEELMQRAEPNTILVSEAASSFLERRFDLRPVGILEREPGRAYRLEGRERTRFGLMGRMARFVGRRHELELVRSRFESAVRGQGQVVGIVGEAGIGKSRLLFEFRQSLAGEPITCLEGHCLSYGAAIPYFPVLEILRMSCGMVETDPPEAMTEKVFATLDRVGMHPAEQAPYLLYLLGLKDGTDRLAALTPEVIKARTFNVLREMSVRRSQQNPLIIVVEDLYWIDKTSEEYFASLAEVIAGARILLVSTYRPGYRPPWIEKSYATQIALQPLAPEESLGVVYSLLGPDQITDSVVQMIVAKAGGNPFFLEELARTVREPGGDLRTLPVPDTVEEVLLARIDQLSEEPKRLLQAASVLGREFPLRLLAAVWEGPGNLDPNLRELTRLEFLHRQSGVEEPVYVFSHALTQEVAYASVLERERRQYHRAVGFAIEELYAGRTDEVVELLAHHFGQSREDEKAVDYAILAAEKAQRRWANAEALSSFDAALKRLDKMSDTEANRVRRIDGVIKQAEVKFALGEHAEHIQALQRIRELVERSADPRRRAAWYYWTGFLHSLTGSQPETAIAYCREASAIADAGGFEEVRALAESCLAQIYGVAGNLRGAVEAGEGALATFEARGNLWWACRTLWILSAAANALGEWARSLEYCRRALEYGRTLNDLRLKVVGLWRTGFTHILRGDSSAGLRCCEEALALSPIPLDVAMIKGVHGYGLVKTGETAAGTVELKEAMAWFDRSHLRYLWCVCGLWLSEGYLRQAERPQARYVVEEVLATSREVGYRHVVGAAYRLLGECLSLEDPAVAAGHLDAAVQILEEIGAHNELAKALVAQAELRRACGDSAAARLLLERALALFDGLGTLDERPRVRAALAALNQAPSTPSLLI
ncbi:MAG: sigma 54-interacting transcriptional regulator [Candidatus Rokubacteria bacterium]|nr:sigma 54-interacting transcriptional regulator [Candidatus Rokubacteria bacterium]